MPGLKPQRLLIAGDRFGQLPQVSERRPQVIDRIDVIGPFPERHAVTFGCLRIPALEVQCVPAIAVSTRVVHHRSIPSSLLPGGYLWPTILPGNPAVECPP